MDLHATYSTLKRLGLVSNHAAFSLDYLNKGPRYLDHLICSGRPPSVPALMALYVRVNAIASARAYPMLPELAQAIWDELAQRSCSLLPPKRKRPAPTRVIEGPPSLPAGAGHRAR